MADSLALICHPSTPAGAVRRIEARARRAPKAKLELTYTLTGDLTRLRLPPPRERRFAERLWEHTCFEAFIKMEETAAYHELNFAPSGEWAVLSFAAYRKGAVLDDLALAPQMAVRSGDDQLALEATVQLDLLSAEYAQAALRIGLSAVIEAMDGTLSYWALRHPPGKPDFHHADAFALRLAP